MYRYFGGYVFLKLMVNKVAIFNGIKSQTESENKI